MSRLKFSSLEVDKNVSQLTSNVKNKQQRTNVRTGVPSFKDLAPGQFVFTTVSRGQDGPSGPASDEGRIYFKDNSENTFVFTGTKIG